MQSCLFWFLSSWPERERERERNSKSCSHLQPDCRTTWAPVVCSLTHGVRLSHVLCAWTFLIFFFPFFVFCSFSKGIMYSKPKSSKLLKVEDVVLSVQNWFLLLTFNFGINKTHILFCYQILCIWLSDILKIQVIFFSSASGNQIGSQDSFMLTLALEDRTFSMLSMLRMQLWGTLLQAAFM